MMQPSGKRTGLGPPEHMLKKRPSFLESNLTFQQRRSYKNVFEHILSPEKLPPLESPLPKLDFTSIRDLDFLHPQGLKTIKEDDNFIPDSPASCVSPLVADSPEIRDVGLNSKIVDTLDEAVGVFCTASRGGNNVYNLIRSNSAFQALFEIETVNMSQTFSQCIFKSVSTNKHACLFTLIEKFIASKDRRMRGVYEICAPDNASSPTSESASIR
jgi:hypothetical protein